MGDRWFEVCRELKAARVKAGLTQLDIGQALGYEQQTISQFERGLNRNGAILLYYLEMFSYLRKPVLNALGCVNEYEGVK